VLAVHAQEILTGGAQRAAVSQVFAAQSYLVSLIDSAYATDDAWVDQLTQARLTEQSHSQQTSAATQTAAQQPPDVIA
jgi:hypothetical protein